MAQAVHHHSRSASAVDRTVLINRQFRSVPTLADDLACFRASHRDDPENDLEIGSWPDLVDQRRLGQAMAGRFAYEDAELDDGC